MKIVFAIAALLVAPLLQATPITFTMGGAATGFLGATPYTSLVITATADTNNVQFFAGGYRVQANLERVQINGGLTATVTDTVLVESGFSGSSVAFMWPLTLASPSLAGYDLRSNITVSGTATPIPTFSTFVLNTTAGGLTIATAGQATFTAVLAPEPSTFTAVFGLGAVVAFGLKRRIRS